MKKYKISRYDVYRESGGFPLLFMLLFLIGVLVSHILDSDESIYNFAFVLIALVTFMFLLINISIIKTALFYKIDIHRGRISSFVRVKANRMRWYEVTFTDGTKYEISSTLYLSKQGYFDSLQPGIYTELYVTRSPARVIGLHRKDD